MLRRRGKRKKLAYHVSCQEEKVRENRRSGSPCNFYELLSDELSLDFQDPAIPLSLSLFICAFFPLLSRSRVLLATRPSPREKRDKRNKKRKDGKSPREDSCTIMTCFCPASRAKRSRESSLQLHFESGQLRRTSASRKFREGRAF